MKTLVLSDLHLGSPLFNKKLEVIALLKKEEYDCIVLNGDIFDIWEQDFKCIIEEYKDFISLINSLALTKLVYFIIGNHDPDLNNLTLLMPNVIITTFFQIKNIRIIHGDEFDILTTKYSLLAKLLFIPHWICQRIFHINIKAFGREVLGSISNKKNKPYYEKLVGDIETKAVLKYKDMCRYLIMGHTHTPKIVGHSECTYINCGDMIHNNVCLEFDENLNFKFIEV